MVWSERADSKGGARTKRARRRPAVPASSAGDGASKAVPWRGNELDEKAPPQMRPLSRLHFGACYTEAKTQGARVSES